MEFSMLKKLMSYAFILGFSSLGHADVTYDGHLSLDANGNQTEYDVFFDITYSYDGREIEGGKLGLGSDGTNQYMYIQHPLGFKDLSYGTPDNIGTTCDGDSDCEAIVNATEIKAATDYTFYENAEQVAKAAKDAAKIAKDAATNQNDKDYYKALEKQYKAEEKVAKKLKEGTTGMVAAAIAVFNGSEKYRVGWNGQNDGNPSLHGAVHSEYFEVSFDGGSNVKFNLGLTEATNSTTNVTGVSGFKSTLDYNRSQVAMLQPGTTDLGAFEAHSPETTDCGNETSSDPSCYIVKDTLENRLNNAGGPIIDWDFNFGIEIQLSNAFFSNLQGITANNFGYKDSSKLIDLVGLHASDPKTIATTKHGHVPCQNPISGLDQNHEACNATVTPHVDVPEPSSIFMFSLGMAGLWLKRKKVIKI